MFLACPVTLTSWLFLSFILSLVRETSVLTPLMIWDVHVLNIVYLNVLYTYVFPHRTVICLKHSQHLKLCLALSRHSNMSEWVMEGWRGNESLAQWVSLAEGWRAGGVGGAMTDRRMEDDWMMEGLVDWERCVDPGGVGGEQSSTLCGGVCPSQISHPEPWSCDHPRLSHLLSDIQLFYKNQVHCIAIGEIPWFWKHVLLMLGENIFFNQLHFLFMSH